MSALNRRQFLTATLAGLATTGVVAACRSGSGTTTSATTAPESTTGSNASATTAASSGAGTSKPSAAPKAKSATTAAAPGKRRLVIIEMSGGNDGMSTLVPYGVKGYRDLRSRTAIDPKDLLSLNDQVGLHKTLKPLQTRGLAIVQGIGTPNPDGSHFAMMDRWWKGDLRGNASLGTGFLGRLADAIGDPAARAVALSIGSGSHPALLSKKAATLSIPRADVANALVGAAADDRARYAFQQALADMAAEAASDPAGLRLARRGNRDAVRFATTLHGLPDKEGEGYPGGNLSDGLRLTARLLAADAAIRIVHVPMGADFDTHEDNPGRHPGLLENLANSVHAFLGDLEARGLSDQVLVATISEFGRTAKDNGSNGLDHGTASCALLAGPVKAGLHGEYPSLTKLTEDGQLIATVGFDQYYAAIAQDWFDVPATDVLSGNAQPLSGLFSV
jgi:uncharacterized protein (DUF1501 family)